MMQGENWGRREQKGEGTKSFCSQGRGCVGSCQMCPRRVRAPHSFILAAGAAAMLCSRLSGDGVAGGAPE